MDDRSGPRILVVDDDSAALHSIARRFEVDGYQVALARSGAEAVELAPRFLPDAVIGDVGLGAGGNDSHFSDLRALEDPPALVIVTAQGSIDAAVASLRAGAVHYLVAPVEYALLCDVLARALEDRALRGESRRMRAALRERLGIGLGPLVGGSPPMRRLYGEARELARTDEPVLLVGETGTGKDTLARAIHRLSPRAAAPFGVVRGAASFEWIAGSSLYFDEITKVPRDLQARLVDSLGEAPLGVRVLAATHHHPQAAIRAGVLSPDLYRLLSSRVLHLPPLRQRSGDVVLLAQHFLSEHNRESGKRILGFTPAARARLSAYEWPGNVHELRSVVERAAVLSDARFIDAGDLGLAPRPEPKSVRIPGATMDEIERHAILASLEAARGSTRRAAQMLGVSPRTIQHRLKQWGMARPRGRPPRASRSGVARSSG